MQILLKYDKENFADWNAYLGNQLLTQWMYKEYDAIDINLASCVHRLVEAHKIYLLQLESSHYIHERGPLGLMSCEETSEY